MDPQDPNGTLSISFLSETNLVFFKSLKSLQYHFLQQ